MKRKKIHIALSYLSVYELNSFKKYLMSPFFNMNEAIVKYFEILDKNIRSQKELSSLENEKVWLKIYPDEPYNEVKFRKLNSDISKHFENFMAVKEMETDQTLTNSLKLRAYKERKITSLYSGLVSHINTAKKSQINRSADYYLDLFNIEKSIFGLQSDAVRKSSSKDPVKDLNIEEISLNLDVFYIAEKLKYYCTILSWRRSYKIENKIAGIEFILKLAQIPLFSEYPPIKIYFTISRTITEEENTDHYFQLKELINDYIHHFPPDEAREIMDAAISYCAVKNNKGIGGFQDELLDLYKKALQEEIILDKDGLLSPIAYRNIAAMAMRSNDLDWAEAFISEYAEKINPDFSENAKNFSLARLNFYKKEYNTVIDYLNKVHLNDFFYNVNVRILMLLAYYELDEILPLESLLQSFNAWVRREKALTKVKKSEFLGLIRFTRRLSNTPKFEKQKLEKLLNEVKDTPAIVSKAWLISKIEEKLGKKKKD